MKEWKADLEFFKWNLNVPVVGIEEEIILPIRVFSFAGEGDMREKIGVLCNDDDAHMHTMTYRVYGN